LNVSLPLLGERANVAPRALAKHPRTKVNEGRALLRILMPIGKAYARTNGKVSGNACSRIMGKKRFQHSVGDGVFSENNVNLFNSEVDLFKALAKGLYFLSQTLELGAVHHVSHPSELVGVEEARAKER